MIPDRIKALGRNEKQYVLVLRFFFKKLKINSVANANYILNN